MTDKYNIGNECIFRAQAAEVLREDGQEMGNLPEFLRSVSKALFDKDAEIAALKDANATQALHVATLQQMLKITLEPDAEIAALRKVGQQALGAIESGNTLALTRAVVNLRQAIAQAVQPTDHMEDVLAMVRPVIAQAVQPTTP